TNGPLGSGWNLDYRRDGTLKNFGHTFTLIGIKRFQPIPSTYDPPAGMTEDRLEHPAFIEAGNNYIHAGADRWHGGIFEPDFPEVRMGTDRMRLGTANHTYYIDSTSTSWKPLSAPLQQINGDWYLPAADVFRFLGLRMRYDAAHQVVLADDQFYLK